MYFTGNFLSPVFLEFPVPVAQGAHVPGLQPPGDAVEVEGVVTHSPGHGALLAGGAGLSIEMHVWCDELYNSQGRSLLLLWLTWFA